jgi:hypothetical protein
MLAHSVIVLAQDVFLKGSDLSLGWWSGASGFILAVLYAEALESLKQLEVFLVPLPFKVLAAWVHVVRVPVMDIAVDITFQTDDAPAEPKEGVDWVFFA